ncbi:MAG: glycosyltransferase WbuB [Methylophilaceae bacterium]|nr:glycosyltransferase WbuB [Methylophilaceae bacterium]
MSKKVLLVTTNYWPEPTGIAIYTTDLAQNLKTRGFQISVVTSLPHYPWWRVPDEFDKIMEGRSFLSGIQIFRARHWIPPTMNTLKRIRFEFSLWWNLRRISKNYLSKDFDIVIAFIPTVAAGIIGKSIAKRLRIPFGLVVQDLSGAGAKQSGLRGGAIFSKLAQFVEGKVFQSADAMVVVSPAMREVVVAHGIPAERVNQVTNYSAKQITILETTSARAKFGWATDEFIVIHTGNIGAKQDLENVVRSAEILKNSPKIKIYLIGHGNQESKLKSMCRDKKNIFVLPAVSEEDYSALLSAADLLLINERITQIDMSLPSKLTSYLFSGKPVLASAPPNGATWKFLDGIAELVEAGNPMALAQRIEELSENPTKLKELSDLGYIFAKENLDAEKGRQKYLDWVNALLKLKSS